MAGSKQMFSNCLFLELDMNLMSGWFTHQGHLKDLLEMQILWLPFKLVNQNSGDRAQESFFFLISFNGDSSIKIGVKKSKRPDCPSIVGIFYTRGWQDDFEVKCRKRILHLDKIKVKIWICYLQVYHFSFSCNWILYYWLILKLQKKIHSTVFFLFASLSYKRQWGVTSISDQ